MQNIKNIALKSPQTKAMQNAITRKPNEWRKQQTLFYSVSLWYFCTVEATGIPDPGF